MVPSAGGAPGALAGARRTDSAYPRLVGASNQADELVFDSTPNPQIPTADGDRVEALPEVSQVGRLRAYSILGKGMIAFGSPTGDAFMASGGVNRAHVRSGRAFDPHNPNEVMIDYSLADQNHLSVGDTLKLQFVPPAAGGPTSVADFSGKPTEVSFRVTAVVATPGQFPPFSTFYFSGPAAYLTPAFVRAHGDDIASYQVSVVRLRHGRADEAAFRAGARNLGAGFQPISFPLAALGAGTQHNLHLQAVALWMLAALLSVVIVLIIVQLLTRQAALESTEWPALWAMGLTRRQLVALGAGRSLWMAAPAALIAVAGAVVLSSFAPIGLAAKAEISPGMAFDTTALVIGAVVVLAAVLIISAWPIWRAAVLASQSLTAGEHRDQQRSSAVAQRIARSALPVTLTAGVSMALEPGRGRTAVPVRSTLVGASVGMVALMAALTFGASLHHLISTPRLFGVGWHQVIQNDNGPAAAALALPVLHDDPNVEAYSWLETNTEGEVGRFHVGMQVIDPIQGVLVPGILAGRAPVADDEIALGATTMRQLHTHIGATISASAIGAASPLLPARVVGRAVLVPAGEASGHLGEGAVITPGGLLHFASGAATTPPFVLAVRFRPGVSIAAAANSLRDRLVKLDGGFEGNVTTPTPPTDLLDFGHVSYLPFALGGILAGLAVLTLGHLLFTSIRRRRRDLAIMKTLGFVRGQVGRTVAWEATTLMAFALIVGVPLGVVAGRVAWTLLAHQLGVLPEPVIPVALVALVIPGMLVLTNLVAVIPAALAARTRPALVLRSE